MSRIEAIANGDVANFVGDRSVKGLADKLQELASPIDRDEKIGTAINRAAERSGLQYWRCFNIWYGKAKHITDEECAAVSIALEKKSRDERRNEWQELWTRLLRLESSLTQTDPDFHRPALDALRARRK